KVTPVPDPKLRVYWPISARFREELANEESRGSGGYRALHKKGALGAYQLTPKALEDIGWRDKQGVWSEASGVADDEAFLNNPVAQEIALKEFLLKNRQYAERIGTLDRIGQTIHGGSGDFAVTENGLAAAMHRQGAFAVRDYLNFLAQQGWTSDQAQWSDDQKKVFSPIEARLRKFADIPYLRPSGR
ncbi:MAG: hypothetical protein ACREDP_23505, partial [Bradyrhizobium sp.]